MAFAFKEGRPGLMDLRDCQSYHSLALSAAGRSPATISLYTLYEKRFLDYLASRNIAPTLDALNPVTVRQAVLWFQQRHAGKRNGEIATKTFLNTLKTWANFLEQEGVYDISPLARVKRMHTRKYERQPYTRTEVNAMLAACEASRQPQRDRLLVLLLLDTGARASEIAGLQLRDVRLDQRTVRVLGKGNRERTIPVGDPTHSDGGPLFRAYRVWLNVREILARRHPERSGDHLLLTLSGFPLTADGITDAIKRLGEAAGVDGAIPHRFRHSYATIYLTRYPGDETGLEAHPGTHLGRNPRFVYLFGAVSHCRPSWQRVTRVGVAQSARLVLTTEAPTRGARDRLRWRECANHCAW